jgi:hypothetical protein
MNLFLRKILLVLIIPSIMFVLFLCYATYISQGYKIKANITNIIVGDSHPKMAFNDSLLFGTMNLALENEPYYYTFYKLKSLIEENSNISTVYLGFGCHNLSPLNDEITSSSYFNGARFFFILPIKEKFRITYWYLKNLRLYIKNILIFGVKSVSKNPSFLGYFENTIKKEASKESMDKRISHVFTKYRSESYSYYNLAYLDSIALFLKKNKIKLIGLNTPVAVYYNSKIPESYSNKFNQIKERYNLKVLNFSKLDLKNNKYFMPDGDHLNSEGAYKVTQELKQFQLQN